MPWKRYDRPAWCGGNRISRAYLDRFNARVRADLARIDGKPVPAHDSVPDGVARFLDGL